MSYLLDALRRSEEERRRGETPDLSTRHGARTVRRRRRDGNGVIVAVALVLALAAFAGGVLWQRASLGGAETAAAPAPAAPGDPGPAPGPAPAPRTAAEAERPAAPIPRGPVPQPGAPAPSPAPAASPAMAAGPVPLAALAPELRRRMPALELTTHVFAPDPALRQVAVNGVVYREGDRIGELVLERITEDGVVVRLDDTRVAIGVLEAWGY
ncbi:MAG: general secretion pathway protein GspB [Pseudomonadales bacterium]|jgi:general secretion pathway protein B|nr:general secretion pathway protein GspB [Pseudomonadales bacterium]